MSYKKYTFYVLHDDAEGQKFIKKSIDDGCLMIFESEEDAQRAKRRHPNTDYRGVDYYAERQPTEQQPINSNLALGAAKHLTNWLEIDICECEGGHSCGYNEVKRTRDALLDAAELSDCRA